MKCHSCSFENTDESFFCSRCGTRLESSERELSATETYHMPMIQLEAGATFAGRYHVIEELGRGGMGRVYKVLDQEIQEKIALKVLKPEISMDKKTIERFRNELKIARKISHKNVCRMYDLMKENGAYFITMEYVSGEDLKSTMTRVGRLSVGKTLIIVKQICMGLAEAHRLGVIHRDLKPHNIMIDRAGEVRIMDFGIARSQQTSGLTESGMMVGTPEYMSPEQAMGEEVDPRSDIYALGIILFELATGTVPFKGDTAVSVALKHKTEKPPDPKTLNGQIPDDLNHLILKCLEKDKKKRFQNVDEVLSEIVAIETGRPKTDKVLSAKPPSEEIPRKRYSYFVLPAIIILAALIGYLIFFPIGKEKVIISIKTNPSQAHVFLEDRELGVSPLEVEIQPGSYQLRLIKEGYITRGESLLLDSDFENTYDLVAVTPDFGSIEITSSPSGAEIYIDDEIIGKTPVAHKAAPGKYGITAKFSGYKDEKEEIEIVAGQLIETFLQFETSSPAYVLKIPGSPAGANVRLDGVFKGTTPLTISWPRNSVRLRIAKSGWSVYEKRITLELGENNVNYSLKREAFQLSVKTTPPGAQVFLEGKVWGTTPVARTVARGKYRIKVVKQGYQTKEDEFTVHADFEKIYELNERQKINISIKVNPKANVFIDDEAIGEVPPMKNREIEEGTHTFTFISIDPDKKYSVKLDLGAGVIWELQMFMESGRFIQIDTATKEKKLTLLTPLK